MEHKRNEGYVVVSKNDVALNFKVQNARILEDEQFNAIIRSFMMTRFPS